MLKLPRLAKRLIVVVNDVCLCLISVWISYFLRLGEFVYLSKEGLFASTVSILVALPTFYVFGLYRVIFRFNKGGSSTIIYRALLVYGFVYSIIVVLIGLPNVPRTVGIIQPVLLLLLILLSRAAAQFWLGDNFRGVLGKSQRKRIMIFGAGASGRQVAAAIMNSRDLDVHGYLDDDKKLHGQKLNGLSIYDPKGAEKVIKKFRIEIILLAIPSVNRHRRLEILSRLQKFKISVRTLPGLEDLATGRLTVSDFWELDINDLLGREMVDPNQNLFAKSVTGKVVMVTGAGGSIGGELCRQILELSPSKIILFEQSEFGLYRIQEQLSRRNSKVTIIPLLGSVQDEDRLIKVMSVLRPHTVYHAAAYKHVPLVEHNIVEGVKNNVLGTLKTARAALSQKIENFVLISTDKAVRPTNIMGASKRLSEIILQALASETSSVNFSMVRFGNVLDSSGSVVPKFRQQIRDGGPVTITHPDITRFFMTIPEAAQLVIQAGAMAKGGEVFVLDMGEPVQIMKLARRMIELSGFTVRDTENPDGDIPIEITGLRPGEKLYEELLIGGNPEPTVHSRIMKAHEAFIPWEELEIELNALTIALNANNVDAVQSILSKLVPEYESNEEIIDWVHVNQLKNQ